MYHRVYVLVPPCIHSTVCKIHRVYTPPCVSSNMCSLQPMYVSECICFYRVYIPSVAVYMSPPCIFLAVCMSPRCVHSTVRTLLCTSPGIRFAVCIHSIPKAYPKITLGLMECKKEQVGKRIRERCLGKSKYYTTAYGRTFRVQMEVICIWAHKNNNTHDYFLARLLLKLQTVADKQVETPWKLG